jgi:hypothetical protein
MDVLLTRRRRVTHGTGTGTRYRDRNGVPRGSTALLLFVLYCIRIWLTHVDGGMRRLISSLDSELE